MEYKNNFQLNFIKKYWHFFVLAILVVIFFIGASSFNYFTQKGGFIKWLSPDETANYNFAKLYAQGGGLEIFEKYNLYADDIIRPRSVRSDHGVLKPVSFLGVILIYGKIAGLIGYKILPYLTPLFASVGIIFYYLLIKKIFGRTKALISALLLASFPPYIYYSARSMFHNVLFVALLIMGLYFGVLMAKNYSMGVIARSGATKQSLMARIIDCFASLAITKIRIVGLFFAALSGFFIGLAVITRASELLWIAPMLIILWLFNIRKIGIAKLLVFLSFLFLTFLPVFYWNKILYGSFWMGGYPEMNQSIAGITSAGSDLVKTAVVGNFSQGRELLEKIKNYVFHFGLYPRQSLKMTYFYFAQMFYWIFIPACLGFLLFFSRIKHWRKKHAAYVFSYFIISLILLFYYGSWEFHDNPDVKSRTIGNSYTRYWLPVYLGAFPFVSLFLIRLTNLFKKNYLISAARILAIAGIFFISISFVMFGSEEGLIRSYWNQRAAKAEYDKVLNLTEGNAVIITRYHDKLFFPERKVIVGLFNDDNMVEQYAKLAELIPVYYYNFTFPEKDFKYLNERRLPPAGLGIMEVKKITDDFTLYRLMRMDKIIPLITFKNF